MGTPSLTRDEAAGRAELLRVERYDIDVDLTGLLDAKLWRAVSTVSFECTSPGASTFVDCVAEVRAATLNGEPVPEDRVLDGRILLPDLREHNVLVVESKQLDTGSSQGIHRTVDPSDGEVYVWTSFEPDDARRAWACFGQPDLKAPHAFSVLAPPGWTVTSNLRASSVTDEGAARRWTFPDTPVLSPYVVVVNAGPFHELHSMRGGRDLGLYCRRSLAQFLERDAQELFTLTSDGLDFFGERFGRPFPQDTYDTVFVPNMGGAMENWGCVTWSDTSLHRSPPTQRERERRAEVLFHEMAHMWFGDLVTMRWWGDLWLNESFAEWAAHWAASQVSEFTDTWTTFLVGSKRLGYRGDMSVTSHPIRQAAGDVDEAAAGFDTITYLKGSSVLKQLVAYVGEEQFLAGLRGYFETHAWGNTTLEDLVAQVSRASGRDLAEWTNAWLDRAGADRIELRVHPDRWVLRTTAPDGGTARPHRLDVGVYADESGALRRTDLVAVEISGELTEVADPPRGDLLLVNDEDLTYAASRPDPGSRTAMLTRAGALPTSMARAMATSTAYDMLLAGEATAEEYIGCASSALRSEPVSAIVQVELGLMVSAAECWTPPEDRQRVLGEIADLAWDLAAGAEIRDAALRTLARTASTDVHIARVREATTDDRALEWVLLRRLAELGRLDDAGVTALQGRDPDPDAWVSALAARTARAERSDKEVAWKSVFVDKSVPTDRLAEVAAGFWRPDQTELVEDYAWRYLDAVTGLGGGLLALGYLIAVFYPVHADSAFADAAEQVAAGRGVNATVRKTLLDRTDTLRRMLRARIATAPAG